MKSGRDSFSFSSRGKKHKEKTRHFVACNTFLAISSAKPQSRRELGAEVSVSLGATLSLCTRSSRDKSRWPSLRAGRDVQKSEATRSTRPPPPPLRAAVVFPDPPRHYGSGYSSSASGTRGPLSSRVHCGCSANSSQTLLREGLSFCTRLTGCRIYTTGCRVGARVFQGVVERGLVVADIVMVEFFELRGRVVATD